MDLELKYGNGSNCVSRNQSDCGLGAPSSGVSTALASVLIFTIVVDILGNVLVILSVYRNKKLRNAGEKQRGSFGIQDKWMLLSLDGLNGSFNGQNRVKSE